MVKSASVPDALLAQREKRSAVTAFARALRCVSPHSVLNHRRAPSTDSASTAKPNSVGPCNSLASGTKSTGTMSQSLTPGRTALASPASNFPTLLESNDRSFQVFGSDALSVENL